MGRGRGAGRSREEQGEAAQVLETSEEAIMEAVTGVPAVAPDTIEAVLDSLKLELDRLGS